MCPAGRINPEDVPSGRGQMQSIGGAVRVCETLERNVVGGRGGGRVWGAVLRTPDNLMCAPPRAQSRRRVALLTPEGHSRVTASIPTAPPHVPGHSEWGWWPLPFVIRLPEHWSVGALADGRG